MKCKICNTQLKGKIGLSRHLKFNHNKKFVDYMIECENLEKPKCICGKYCKYKDGVKFLSTCGNKICIKIIQKEKRLKFMKENPEKTAWRKSGPSYPESLFIKELKKRKWNKKFLIIRERSVFPYFIDFAFENEKVAVEIDGSQHENEEQIKKDNKKDNLLLKEGWRVYRVTAKQINKNIKEVFDDLLKFIGQNKTKYKCNIIEYESKVKINLKNLKLQRLKNKGLTDNQLKSSKKSRKVNRPNYTTLLKEVIENGYVSTGKKYGVSDNSIRKWIKFYEKYT